MIPVETMEVARLRLVRPQAQIEIRSLLHYKADTMYPHDSRCAQYSCAISLTSTHRFLASPAWPTKSRFTIKLAECLTSTGCRVRAAEIARLAKSPTHPDPKAYLLCLRWHRFRV